MTAVYEIWVIRYLSTSPALHLSSYKETDRYWSVYYTVPYFWIQHRILFDWLRKNYLPVLQSVSLYINKELWEFLASQSFMYVSYKPLLREFTCVFYYFRLLTGGALALLILWALFKRTYFLNLHRLYSKLSIYSINISLCSRHRRKIKSLLHFPCVDDIIRSSVGSCSRLIPWMSVRAWNVTNILNGKMRDVPMQIRNPPKPFVIMVKIALNRWLLMDCSFLYTTVLWCLLGRPLILAERTLDLSFHLLAGNWGRKVKVPGFILSNHVI